MKRTLIAVCGLAPQVITETLYALYQQERLPDSVKVLTTRKGKEACHAQLFSAGDGQYHKFCADYTIESTVINFSPQNIIAVTDDQGRSIDDIANEDDNRIFLRACMIHAYEASNNSDSEVFYSIAGGRKTMGACLAAAAQLYGRPQDRIFHVLVSPEFENSCEFYYPPLPPREITLFDEKRQQYRKNTRYATIQLVTMPFVALRDKLSGGLLQQVEMPETLLMALVEEEKPLLTIDLSHKKLRWKRREADLSPTLLALYAFFAQWKKSSQCQDAACRGCSNCFLQMPQILEPDNLKQIATLYQRIRPSCDAGAMSDTGILSLSAENFNSLRSKLNRRLLNSFGAVEKEYLELTSRGIKPGVRYGLQLEPEKIQLVW